MSSWEFTQWLQYNKLEPFGDERADYRSAIIACTLANIHGRKKGQKPFKPADFMPKFGEVADDRRQDAKEIEATLRGYAIAHNRARKNRAKRLGPLAKEAVARRSSARNVPKRGLKIKEVDSG